MTIMQLGNLSPEGLERHIKENGDYNDFPPHWTEINEGAFCISEHFLNRPAMIEFRQMRDKTDPRKPIISAHLHWQEGLSHGYAIVPYRAEGKVRFFRFGCPHQWAVTPYEILKSDGVADILPGLHYYRCKRCSLVWSQDSSD